VLARPDFTRTARAVAEAGGAALALHLRGPGTGGRRLHDLAIALRPALRASGGMLVVNDRIDVALAAGADGVQLGARTLSVEDGQALAGASLRIGASVHAADEARAVAAGADWLLAGTIWPTPSHPGRPGAGLALLREVAALGTPVVAIGGVSAERAAEARRAGAAGVAALRGLWDAPDAARAVERYLTEWSRG
jgi:thiamine-phosphate diphosphorylase